MLFKKATLDLIQTGEVTLAFRKWKRPTIKQGGTLLTRVGQLKIHNISPIHETEITEIDLRKAGISQLSDLMKIINLKSTGQLYRIEFELVGEDPRIALRNKIDLEEKEIQDIVKRLDRMDRSARYGPWTWKVLSIIDARPETRAGDLSEVLSFEKAWLKTHIRKLKSLGLTISMGVGYRISPRGKSFMKWKKRN